MKKNCPLRITLERKPIINQQGHFHVLENGDTQLIQIEWNHKLITKDQQKIIKVIDKQVRLLLKQQLGQGGT